MNTRAAFSLLLTSGALLLSTSLAAGPASGDAMAAGLLAFSRQTCHGWEQNAEPAPGFATGGISSSEMLFQQRRIGMRYRLSIEDNASIDLEVIEGADGPKRFISKWFDEFGDPRVMVSLAADCSLRGIRRVQYTNKGQAIDIVTLDAELQPQGEPDWINPPLVLAERPVTGGLKHPGGAQPLRVALVDSGVNYQLPEIRGRLARDQNNRLIGYDFWDMDELPYDAHPVNAGFFLQRHGTRTASLLLRETEAVELVPYRYPRPDMSRMQALVEHANRHRVAIVGMPLGSNRPEDWGSFASAARANPQMLFIVSAGNDGRDIDRRPVYPASLGLDNMIVVTSADDFAQPAERTNWGRISVDYLVPAEQRLALDYRGTETRVSGSSYAVARVTALAARIKQQHPDWQAPEIIAELRRRYGGISDTARDWVSSGYIPDPLAGSAIEFRPLAPFSTRATDQAVDANNGYTLTLDILLLDPRWSPERVDATLQQAFEILAQCGIDPGQIEISRVVGAEYLRDLATGSAHTLLAAVTARRPIVVFARDTRMRDQYLGEAFGLGNTRMRPWLANTVWLMLDVDDAGIALAHELYHVLANDGRHVVGQANLMQARTRPESLALTPEQCRMAQVNAEVNGLLSKP